jgi:hypothetical protein
MSRIPASREHGIRDMARDARDRVHHAWPLFVDRLRKLGWDVDGGLTVPGKPDPVIMYISETSTSAMESKKTQ